MWLVGQIASSAGATFGNTRYANEGTHVRDVVMRSHAVPLHSFDSAPLLSCLVCTVLCSALLRDARFGLHFFLGSPDISYFISTDFDRNQLL